MPHNRRTVIGICAISWSLLLLPVLTHLIWKFADGGSHPSPFRIGRAWMNSISNVLHLPHVLLPALIACLYLGFFVLAAASTSELALSKWGIVKDEPDDVT